MVSTTTVVRSLNAGLRHCLETSDQVILVGEDILDPYGGAFKVTAGLSTSFPDQVLTTPISEAAIVGVCIGAALRGLLPVVEIMFGDFVTLAADQIINHAAKFAGMYNGQVKVPMVIRTPMGGGRGYGATHSQSLEKHFLGIPGLRVVAVSPFHDVGELLVRAILKDPMPVLFIEHKLFYPLKLHLVDDGELRVETLAEADGLYPTVVVSNYPPSGRPDVTVVSYGGMARHVDTVLRRLRREEIWVEAVLVSELSRTAYPEVLERCARSGRVILAEEGTKGFGWTAEIAAQLLEKYGDRSEKLVVRRIQSAKSIVPAERSMEEAMLPSATRLEQEILQEVAL